VSPATTVRYQAGFRDRFEAEGELGCAAFRIAVAIKGRPDFRMRRGPSRSPETVGRHAEARRTILFSLPGRTMSGSGLSLKRIVISIFGPSAFP
jgi:hypothetical protein